MTCIRCKHNTAYKFGTYGKRKVQLLDSRIRAIRAKWSRDPLFPRSLPLCSTLPP